jgi:hypothetical protein
MINMPSFVKIGSDIHNLVGGRRYTCKHVRRQQDVLRRLLLLFSKEGSSLKIKLRLYYENLPY